ncbi:MAG: DUF998 domain-containing protein [Archaeoglobaceae archaeon]|nr:DUF998 domain-containing protein [Archaeoglobales archaeon]
MELSRILCFLIPAIPIISIFTAITVILDFNIPENSIRELGRLNTTANMFNYSLILAGILGIFLSSMIYFKVSNALGRIALSFLITSYAFTTLIGVFPLGTELHSSLCLGLLVSILLSMSLLTGYLNSTNTNLSIFNAILLFFGSIALIYNIFYAKNMIGAEILGLFCFTIWHFTVLVRLS